MAWAATGVTAKGSRRKRHAQRFPTNLKSRQSIITCAHPTTTEKDSPEDLNTLPVTASTVKPIKIWPLCHLAPAVTVTLAGTQKAVGATDRAHTPSRPPYGTS